MKSFLIDNLKNGSIGKSTQSGISIIKLYWPGIFISVGIAFTSLFLSNHYGGPAFLFALLVGISVNFVRNEEIFIPGIDFTAKIVLRIGVALLGLRIGVEELASLGSYSIILVFIALLVTIAAGIGLARLLSQTKEFGLLIGGATAICGASAALAISCCLPNYKNKERDLLFTIIIVTTLSTLAMAFYPVLAGALNFNDVQAGFFIGATIHDVAQVVGAGYSISHEAGDIAVLTKLLRVACLVPIVSVLALIFKSSEDGSRVSNRIPLFLLAFIFLAVLNSFHLVPKETSETINYVSRFLLIMSIAAIGTKTYPGDLIKFGWKAFLLPVFVTILLAIIIMTGVLYGL